jgi:hypothetical protein
MLRSRCGTVFHISDLVQLATLDHWVVGHVDHGLAQRLGPVDPDEHRARERMRWGMLPRIRGPVLYATCTQVCGTAAET